MIISASANECYWTRDRPEGEFKRNTAKEVSSLLVLPVIVLLCW